MKKIYETLHLSLNEFFGTWKPFKKRWDLDVMRAYRITEKIDTVSRKECNVMLVTDDKHL